MEDKIRDRLWEKAGRQGIPLAGSFELLPLCNLSCKMCYVRKSAAEVQAAGGLLNGDRWLALAREAADLGMLFPLLTGGEPFLHPDFRQILSGMLDMGMQVSVNTNATMIDAETAEWLSVHRPIRLNITLYGASGETYQRLCGSADAFEKVRNAVKYLKKYKLPVKFNTSITPYNADDLEAMMSYAKSVGSPIQVATYMFPPIRRNADMVGQNDRLTPEEAGRLRVKADFLQSDPDWFCGQAERFSHFLPLEEALNRQDISEEGMEIRCRAGRSSLWIDWQGDLLNCGMYGSVKFSLKDRKLSDVWQEMVEQTRQLRYSPACKNCANRILCHPCIAMVSNECGDRNGRPDYLCRMNESAAKYYRLYAEKLSQTDRKLNSFAVSEIRDCDMEDI
ncbi:MAG: radical SAM protein [Eubacteriales bacterium]